MLELFSANNMEWQKDEIDLWTCKHCLEAALYSHKQRKVSVWNEAEKYGGPQLSRFTNYLRPKPYTLQQNIPNYWECLFQFGAAQPFFTPWPAGNLDCGTTLEWLWFRRQTFHIQCRHTRVQKLPMPDYLPLFQTNISLFQTLFRSGKLLCKFQDFFKNLRLCTDPVWGFFFLHEVLLLPWSIIISLWVFVFALRFVVLPWGFWFCHKYLLLPWREVFPIAVTVADHCRQRRLLSQATGQQTGTAWLHLHGKLCRYMHSKV